MSSGSQRLSPLSSNRGRHQPHSANAASKGQVGVCCVFENERYMYMCVSQAEEENLVWGAQCAQQSVFKALWVPPPMCVQYVRMYGCVQDIVSVYLPECVVCRLSVIQVCQHSKSMTVNCTRCVTALSLLIRSVGNRVACVQDCQPCPFHFVVFSCDIKVQYLWGTYRLMQVSELFLDMANTKLSCLS